MRDEIIADAREAGFVVGMSEEHWGVVPYAKLCHPTPTSAGFYRMLERFYDLAVQRERNRTWTQQHWTDYEKAIVAKEREECAKVCEEHPDGLNMMDGAFVTCAVAIRARGAQE